MTPFYVLRAEDGRYLESRSEPFKPALTSDRDRAAYFLARQPIYQFWAHLICAGWVIEPVDLV